MLSLVLDTNENILHKCCFYTLVVYHREFSSKVRLGLLRMTCKCDLDVDMPELLIVVLVAEYSVDELVFSFIFDTYLDTICGYIERVKNRDFRNLFFKYLAYYIECFCKLLFEFSLEHNFGSTNLGELFLEFFGVERHGEICKIDF